MADLDSTAEPDQRKYVFGDFVLDTRRGALLSHGKEVKLRPQSFDVLKVLVEHHGNLVSKDELHRRIWANKVVTDDSITHCLLDIRKALGDAEKTAIRTVPRRGYIFELPCQIEELRRPVSISPRQKLLSRSGIAAIALVAAAALFSWIFDIGSIRSGVVGGANSIAVLPFTDMSAQQDQQYLGDGLSDDILNMLSRSPDLRVIARTSSFSIAKESLDIAAIRDALNVAFVLEGSIQRTGDRLKITAQLIDTRDSSNIWAERFERHSKELLAVQQEIVESILWHIAPETDKNIATPAMRNFSAHELMLLARYYEQEVRELPEVDENMLGKAISLYRDAVRADPDSALAHSRLAGALLYSGNIVAAEQPTRTALKLDPSLSEAHEALGRLLWTQGLPGAGAAWKSAVELNPNNADAISAYAYWFWMQGHSDEPPKLFRRALEIDPLSLARFGALGESYAHLAMIPEALDIADLIEKNFNDAAAYRLIARLMELVGRIDESIAWTIRARDLEPENREHVAALAELYAEIGDFDTALKLEPKPGIGLLYKMRNYRDMIDLAELRMIDYPDDIELRYALAYANNVMGNPEVAIRLLRESGLPATVRPEARQARDIEALITLIDALIAVGDSKQAHDLAEWWEARRHTNNDNWWILIYRACPLAVSGFEDEALDLVVRVADSPRLPWESHIRDMPCFQRFSENPRYRAMLDTVDQRRQRLRDQLSDTLRAYNVSL